MEPSVALINNGWLKSIFVSSFSWGKRAAYNRAQIAYYLAENLELRRSEFADRIKLQTGRSSESCLKEVDLSIQRLFHWAAYADKYGGGVQVRGEFHLLVTFLLVIHSDTQ